MQKLLSIYEDFKIISVSFAENKNTISTDLEYPCSQIPTTEDTTVESTSQSTTLGNPCSMCNCSNQTSNKTAEEIQESIARIQQALFVDSKTLTSHKIKKISAADDRTSSTAMGGVAIAVLVMVVCVILLIDLLHLVRWYQSPR